MLERWIAGLGGALLVAVAPASAQLDQRALLSRIETDLFGLPAPASLGEPLRLWATWYHVPSSTRFPTASRSSTSPVSRSARGSAAATGASARCRA